MRAGKAKGRIGYRPFVGQVVLSLGLRRFLVVGGQVKIEIVKDKSSVGDVFARIGGFVKKQALHCHFLDPKVGPSTSAIEVMI